MFKILNFVTVLFFIIGCSNSQKSLLENELIAENNEISKIGISSRMEIPFCIFDGKCYFVDDVNTNDIILKAVKGSEIELIKLPYKHKKKLVLKDIDDIFVDQKHIMFYLNIHDEYESEYLLLYDFSSKKLVKKYKLNNFSWQSVSIIDDKIYLVRHYHHDNDLPEKYKIRSGIEVRDLNNFNFLNETNLDLTGTAFSHFKPNKIIEINANINKILVSDYDKYELKLLDENLNVIDRFTYKPKDWSPKYDNSIQEIRDSCNSLYGFDRMKYLENLQKEGMSRMIQVGFINDSTVYAAYYSGDKKELKNRISKFDILRIRNNKFYLLYEGITDKKFNNYYPLFFFNNVIKFEDNTAYFFSMGSYKAFLNMNTPEWIKHTLSALTGSEINMNLVEIKFHDL